MDGKGNTVQLRDRRSDMSVLLRFMRTSDAHLTLPVNRAEYLRGGSRRGTCGCLNFYLR